MPRALGHRHVDRYHRVERIDRLAHALAIGERMYWVGAFDDHRAEALRMIGKDFVGNDIAGNHAADDAMASDWTAAILGHIANQFAHAGMQVHPALAAEVSGDAKNQLLEIRVERAVRRHLDAEVLEHRHSSGRARDSPRHLAHPILGQTGTRTVISNRDRKSTRLN